MERAALGDGRALAELARFPEAALDIVRHLRSNEEAPWPIAKVLVDVVAPEVEGELIALFEEAANPDIALIAARALLRVSSPRGIDALARGLRDERRRMSIDALGDSRRDEARAPLEKELDRLIEDTGLSLDSEGSDFGEDVDPADVELVPLVLANLAKVGSRRPEHRLLLTLLRLEVDDPYFGAEAIRADAALATKVVVVEGMVPALAAFIDAEPSREAVDGALDALFHLGTRDALGVIAETASKPGLAQRHATYRLDDLVAPIGAPSAPLEQLLESAARMLTKMEPGICHRAGVPLRIHDLEVALTVPERRVAVLEELEIITAAWIGYDRYLGEASWIDHPSRFRAWLETHGADYPVGGLFKSGRQMNEPSETSR
ncbi:MAG: HEAT repeat domain-containing protein [Myxococcales bacterium]|nr:HEAT repeat domain-containing protein [Myxococcales bacterium]